MGVDYHTCDNCNEAMSEYDYLCCEDGHILCDYCLPKDLIEKYGNADSIEWEDEITLKYCLETDDYGLTLKKEFCPICLKEEKYKDDKQYKEFLRLKAIYG